MINELIEQIGGRDALINFMQNGVRPSWIEVEMMSRALLAVLDAQEKPESASAPDGWKLVPVEPTTEMIKMIHPIAEGTCHHCYATVNPDCETNVLLSWTDMLAAAPAPGGEK